MTTGPSQTLPAPSGYANFKYEPLKSSSARPSIRLVILQPASSESSIRIKLVHKAFADRPEYQALSYIWGRPDVVKAIELDGICVDIRENLWFALVHLRDARRERVLWIDAICINQADLEERSEQVRIMAYIYERAKKVIVWLGVIEKFEPAEPEEASDQEAFDLHTLTLQPYWWRVWIVQEIGSAMESEVHWGLWSKSNADARGYHLEHNFISRFEPWNQFFRRMRPEDGWENEAISLAQQREGRHGDNFLLTNLMEACQRSNCEEPRDKVYGFIGIAHDCQEEKFPVDYSKPLYELYEDVVRFRLRAKDGSKEAVHFSVLVQHLFGGRTMMQQDLIRMNFGWPKFREPEIVTVVAEYYGMISLVGPSYDDLIALPEASQQWKAALSRSKPRLTQKLNEKSRSEQNNKKKSFLERLRKKNEIFMRMLYNLDSSSLARLAPIDSRLFWDGIAAKEDITLDASGLPLSQLLSSSSISHSNLAHEKKDEPRLFSTDDGVIGLMPPSAQAHDTLFKFYRSNTVAVVRIPKTGDANFARLIGQALVVPGKNSELGFDMREARSMKMDIRLLQLLTE